MQSNLESFLVVYINIHGFTIMYNIFFKINSNLVAQFDHSTFDGSPGADGVVFFVFHSLKTNNLVIVF